MRSPLTFSSNSSSLSKQIVVANNHNDDIGCSSLKKGQWTPEEDEKLSECVKREGEGKWQSIPKKAGLLRCGKSCRLRWINYLSPKIKRGHISPGEEDLILRLHRLLGNRWSLIAGRIPGRTDNEIKNYWNSHMKKKLLSQGIDPKTHKPILQEYSSVKTKAKEEVVINSVDPIPTVQISSENTSKVPEKISVDGEGQEFNNFLLDQYDEEFSLFLNSLINEDIPNNNHIL